jgi:hypothetical protein
MHRSYVSRRPAHRPRAPTAAFSRATASRRTRPPKRLVPLMPTSSVVSCIRVTCRNSPPYPNFGILLKPSRLCMFLLIGCEHKTRCVQRCQGSDKRQRDQMKPTGVPVRVVYVIVGAHSGATLLAILRRSHSDIQGGRALAGLPRGGWVVNGLCTAAENGFKIGRSGWMFGGPG